MREKPVLLLCAYTYTNCISAASIHTTPQWTNCLSLLIHSHRGHEDACVANVSVANLQDCNALVL